ncbi:sensor histidine kinase [Anaerocolumna chitinilytica]|uniref:histidine kinase n=1 Tax=Anaerocolumna chitinilytica TaxID=1727145 RepID=A0A7M3S999_9FIRM|nr:histidine kinase [Anaerocolumna chitinilytica]BCK01167.1 putative two-component sensor kinase [Anaerocolumna chitinilytica]
MNIGRWFKNIKFIYKLIIGYVIFAILPMIIVTGYNSQKTKGILLEESYRNMRQSLVQIGQNLDSSLEAYGTVMDILYTNQMFNGYLVKDYTESDYWEMFSYIDNLLSSIMLVESNIAGICIYSNNDTLPSDNYYFYREEALDQDWLKRAISSNENPQVAGVISKGKKKYIGLERLLNYYHYSEVRNTLLLKVDVNFFNEQMKITNNNQEVYWVNSQGQVMASSDKESIGNGMETITADWKDIPVNGDGSSINVNGVTKVCTAHDSLYGTKILMMVNQESLVEATRKVAQDIIFIFFLSSLVMFLAIYLYSKWISGRVNKVVYAAKKLGDGEFDYLLNDMGKDEMGIIASAINTLNSEIQLLIAENYEKKLKIKSSEMNLLQEQINPHFLYNALSVISSVAMQEGGKKTVISVRYLANFYRISLNKGKQVVSVQEEVELLQNYMKIQMLRFEDTVEINYEVDRRALAFRTIKLLLQPLVENAIHHGRKDEEQVLHIWVTVSVSQDRVVYEVKDDGLGIGADKLERLRKELKNSEEGYGLKNVDIRVKLNYGEQYGVSISSNHGEGTCVRVEIPQVFS